MRSAPDSGPVPHRHRGWLRRLSVLPPPPSPRWPRWKFSVCSRRSLPLGWDRGTGSWACAASLRHCHLLLDASSNPMRAEPEVVHRNRTSCVLSREYVVKGRRDTVASHYEGNPYFSVHFPHLAGRGPPTAQRAVGWFRLSSYAACAK